MINEAYKLNFEQLVRAIQNNEVALVECTDANTNEVVIAVCAVNYEDPEFMFVPLAKMFNGDPYEELTPPSDAPAVADIITTDPSSGPHDQN